MSGNNKSSKTTKPGRDYGSLGGRHSGSAVSFLDADAEALRQCIESVTLDGDAVLFARTSDGGAVSVRVLSNGETFAHYPTSHTALNELLSDLVTLSST